MDKIVKKYYQQNIINPVSNQELDKIYDNLHYDFKKLELKALAQKISSKTIYKPKPKMYYL